MDLEGPWFNTSRFGVAPRGINPARSRQFDSIVADTLSEGERADPKTAKVGSLLRLAGRALEYEVIKEYEILVPVGKNIDIIIRGVNHIGLQRRIESAFQELANVSSATYPGLVVLDIVIRVMSAEPIWNDHLSCDLVLRGKRIDAWVSGIGRSGEIVYFRNSIVRLIQGKMIASVDELSDNSLLDITRGILYRKIEPTTARHSQRTRLSKLSVLLTFRLYRMVSFRIRDPLELEYICDMLTDFVEGLNLANEHHRDLELRYVDYGLDGNSLENAIRKVKEIEAGTALSFFGGEKILPALFIIIEEFFRRRGGARPELERFPFDWEKTGSLALAA